MSYRVHVIKFEYRHTEAGKSRVPETTAYVGGAIQRMPTDIHIWGYLGVEREEYQMPLYVGRTNQEFQKWSIMMAEQDIALQQADHIGAFMGGQMELIRNLSLCGRGKTESLFKYLSTIFFKVLDIARGLLTFHVVCNVRMNCHETLG